ncbi:MAG: O-antigen ligase family protein, partial [Acidobacteriota bacterium]|nr:O-antigen ligase family protein [Acidobacteriota bacterium]
AVTFLLLGALVWTILDLPVMVLVRIAFIASFFIKTEISLFKIDEVEDPSGFNLSLAIVCAAVLLAHDWLMSEDSDEARRFPPVFTVLAAGLMFCAVLSVFYSGAETLGYFSLWSLAGSLMIVCALASHFATRERIIELLFSVGAGLILTGATALSQFAVDFPSHFPLFGTGTEDELLGTQAVVLSRAQSFLRTPTEMSWVVSTLSPLVIAPLICQVAKIRLGGKLIFAAAGLAGTLAIILSLARGSWFGLIAAIGILLAGGWWRLSSAERKKYLLASSGALLLGAILLAPLADRIYERLTADDDGSAAIRLPLLEVAKDIIEDNPLVGIGLNNYRATMTRYDKTGIFVSQIFPNPVHNVFAHVAAEIGVPGGILFCLLILTAVLINLRTMRDTDDQLRFALALAIFAGLAAWTISAMKEPSSLGSARPAMRTLFFMFGITLAVSRLSSPPPKRNTRLTEHQ